MHFRPPFRRAVGAAALAAGLLFATGGAALAHVTVRSDTSAPDGWAQLTFRVPTESATASTTRLMITLPQDTPLAHVSTRPLTGWDVTVKEDLLPTPVQLEGGATLTKAAHVVTWQAEPGHAIKPGEFSISVGPLPANGTLLLPATRGYSDGSVVNWDEPAIDGKEPEHPAPSIAIAAADPASMTVATSTDPAPSG